MKYLRKYEKFVLGDYWIIYSENPNFLFALEKIGLSNPKKEEKGFSNWLDFYRKNHKYIILVKDRGVDQIKTLYDYNGEPVEKLEKIYPRLTEYEYKGCIDFTEEEIIGDKFGL